MINKSFILTTQLSKQQIALFYLGQEGFLLKYRDKYLAIDPYLSDYVDKNCCTETVTWARKYPAPLTGRELDFLDYVLCTHAHFDHMDPLTLGEISSANPNTIFIVPEPSRQLLESYGISPRRIIGAVSDSPLNLDGFSVLPLPSAHEELHQDEQGHYLELGYKILAGDISLYHAGDCCLYEGLTNRLENTDILMLPINGRSFYKLENDIIGNMTIEEAILLAKQLQPDLLIPMHYDLYEVNGVNPAHFVDLLYTLNPRQPFHMFTPGERYFYQKN